MTHPTLTPRGEYRAAVEPAPIELILRGMSAGVELEKRGGCEGVTGRIVKCTVGECLACGRLPVGGVQIQPRYVRQGAGIICQDWVHVGATVLPIARGAETAERGGLAAGKNTAPEGVAP